MILNRDEYFNRLHAMVGTDTTDESISFIEDMTDTYNDMENRLNGDGTDWEAKYKELDKSWREKYRHRFFSGNGGAIEQGEPDPDENEYNPDDVKIDDLFEEVK